MSARSLQSKRRRVPHEQRASITNYGLLKQWLEKNNARLQTETEMAMAGDPENPNVIQTWLIRSAVVVVILYPRGCGWDLFTSYPSIQIDETLRDAEARCGLPIERAEVAP